MTTIPENAIIARDPISRNIRITQYMGRNVIPYTRRVAVDFDGVIHKARRGKLDGSIYDEPDTEVLAGMHDMMQKGFVLFVYSARNSEEVRAWMEERAPWFGKRAAESGAGFPVQIIPTEAEYWDELNVLGITRKKYAALIYIDDHGFQFTGSWQAAVAEFEQRQLRVAAQDG